MNDEAIYAAVTDELEHGGPIHGLWTKALVCAGGDEESARLIYIELRKDQLMTAVAAEARAVDRPGLRVAYWRLAFAMCLGTVLAVIALDSCAV